MNGHYAIIYNLEIFKNLNKIFYMCRLFIFIFITMQNKTWNVAAWDEENGNEKKLLKQ
jgi:hypothetical protein